jgi:hypothetical protein
MGSLEKALRYPFSGEGWGAKFILGGCVCTLASAFGFIPFVGWLLWSILSLIPVGYAYGIFKDRLEGKGDHLPSWFGWGDLLYRGFFIFLIFLAYGLIPGILYAIGDVLWNAGGFAAFFGLLFLILGVGIGFGISFLLPMALSLYAAEGEFFVAVFRWDQVVEKIWLVQREYFTAWLAGLIFFLALLFIRIHVFFVGWILYSFGFFYLSLILAHLFGGVCRGGTGEEF